MKHGMLVKGVQRMFNMIDTTYFLYTSPTSGRARSR
jgi:hypothetical protein